MTHRFNRLKLIIKRCGGVCVHDCFTVILDGKQKVYAFFFSSWSDTAPMQGISICENKAIWYKNEKKMQTFFLSSILLPKS